MSTVARPSNVLISSEDGESPVDVDGPRATAFVVVSLVDGPDGPIAFLEEVNRGRPDAVHVIGTEGSVRGGEYDSVRTVSRPDDLTGLGVRIGDILTELHDEDVHLYFDDLSTVLQHTDLNTVFRFLNVLTGRLQAADAVGFFGVTPTLHDEEEMETLRHLLDGAVGDFS